jgi:hypothetical protein
VSQHLTPTAQFNFRSLIRRPLVREFIVFLVFLLVTAIMTWPWVLHLRDAVPDPGDPYAISYFLWWDFHQTFHDPLNLFQATIFYPYHYTLAFGEFDYGVSLLFFPLFALGIRPLTVYSVAAFLSFPFTAYGTFRLARTLSGCLTIAWISGLIIAFLPFRFHHLAHLHLIFVGWVPLLFEALILFARQHTWRRAIWLGIAFLMNALTCTTWLILTIIPLVLSAIILLSRNKAWTDRKFWFRAAATLGLASLLLLPFLLPLRRVAAEHGFVRRPEEVTEYSAKLINWLAPDARTRSWRGFGKAGSKAELVLFPGLMAPLLTVAALLLTKRKVSRPTEEKRNVWKTIALRLLDATAIITCIIAFLTIGYDVLKLKLFGHLLLVASGPDRALLILTITLIVRCLLEYPLVLRNALGGDRNLLETFNSPERSELSGHALVWITIGFAGSFGLNFYFHKFLYENITLFRGMRVASRWAMIAYVGLALLAGLGTKRLGDLVAGWWPRFGRPLLYVLIVIAILIDLRVAPLPMLKGEADPDAITLDLKSRQMKGAILSLPIGDQDHIYMLRAADHGHPIVNGTYSFVPQLPKELRELVAEPPAYDQLLDKLETIPVSYLSVHRARLSTAENANIDELLNKGVAAGRLRFIKSFPPSSSESNDLPNDLYAVTKTEPKAGP